MKRAGNKINYVDLKGVPPGLVWVVTDDVESFTIDKRTLLKLQEQGYSFVLTLPDVNLQSLSDEDLKLIGLKRIKKNNALERH